MMHFRINHRDNERVALPVWRGISISPWRLSRIVALIRPTTNHLLTVTHEGYTCQGREILFFLSN